MSAVVGRRYAAALLQESADEDAARSVGEALRVAVEVLERPAARMALQVPNIPDDDRTGVLGDLAEAMGLPSGLRSFLQVVLQAGRIGSLPAIEAAYTELFEDRFQVRTAHIETASPLGDEEQAKLIEKLEALIGVRIQLEIRENPELLAGWRARVGNHLIEADLAGQAHRLADRVVKG